ncbi:MAG: hypothetical protein AAB355_03520 [Patescibacteria group bacterium]
MSLFAHKIAYAAHDGETGASFMALIELAGRKGGTPKGFLLYRCTIQYDGKTLPVFEMINLLKPKNSEEAKEFFIFGGSNKFPGHRSILWRKTSKWLYAVAVGGGYQQHRDGTWVRVARPAPWSKRRKKKRLIVGSASHLLLVEQERWRSLKEMKESFFSEQSCLESYDDVSDANFVPPENFRAYEAIELEIAKIEEEIDLSSRRILNIKDELRFVLARKMGRRYFPRDPETGCIRKGA